MIDRAGLADFLRRRREALQPEDVGLPRGARRRTPGLRREEVAALSHMSTDFYSRIERERGPQPSEQMVASIAQGLHLSLDERDHLFRLAGHQPPTRGPAGDHIAPGMLRIFDRLTDTPAEIVTELGETLRQTPLSVALVGDAEAPHGSGPEHRLPVVHRPGRAAAHPARGPRLLLADVRLRAARHRDPPGSGVAGRRARRPAARAGARSSASGGPRTRSASARGRSSATCTRPSASSSLSCQIVQDPFQSHSLLVYTATPGSPSHDGLRLLAAAEAPVPEPVSRRRPAAWRASGRRRRRSGHRRHARARAPAGCPR